MTRASPTAAADCPLSPDLAYLRSFGLRYFAFITELIEDCGLPRPARQFETAIRVAAMLKACISHLIPVVNSLFGDGGFNTVVILRIGFVPQNGPLVLFCSPDRDGVLTAWNHFGYPGGRTGTNGPLMR